MKHKYRQPFRPGIYFIHKHEVALQYGGPEEGGWWFDSGTPAKRTFWQVIPRFTEESAYRFARKLNEREHIRAQAEEDYDYTSVLAYRSTHYSYSVEKWQFKQTSYPEFRPHYE